MSEDSVKGAPGEATDLAYRAEAARSSDPEAQHQLQRRLLELEQSERAARLTTPGIAHDLRNLLTVISAHAELALGHPALEAEIRDDLQGMVRAIERASAIVLLLHADAGGSVMPLAPIALNVSLAGACDLLKVVLGSEIELRVNSRAAERIWVDELQFERILINLVLNARDAMPGGGVITLETEDVVVSPAPAHGVPCIPPGRYAVLRVRDTGVGMSLDTREQLFRPFFTTKEKGKGTGLGLTTVASLVAGYGGSINVQSSPGVGTTFEIYFRVERPQASQTRTLEQPSVLGPSYPVVAAEAALGFPALEVLRRETGHIAIGWVADGVLFASFHGHLSCALSDAYVAHLKQLLAGRTGVRYFVDSSGLDSFELAARTATIGSLATFVSSIASVLVLKWSGGESRTGRTLLQELTGLLRTTDNRAEFDAALRVAVVGILGAAR